MKLSQVVMAFELGYTCATKAIVQKDIILKIIINL
jgi:hypothetical protein